MLGQRQKIIYSLIQLVSSGQKDKPEVDDVIKQKYRTQCQGLLISQFELKEKKPLGRLSSTSWPFHIVKNKNT